MSDVNVNHLIHLSLVKIAKNLQSRKGCELRRTLLLSSLLDRARYIAATPGDEGNEMMVLQDKTADGAHNDAIADDNYDESENHVVCQQSQQGMEDLSVVSMDCENTTDDNALMVQKDDQSHDDIHDNSVDEDPRLINHPNCTANKRKLVNKDQVVPGDPSEIHELEYYSEEDDKDQNSLMDLCSPTKRIKVY